MKRLILLVAMCLLVGTVSADAFSAWSAYGDAWKATNDTYTIVMWNATGFHTWLSTGNATSVNYTVAAAGGGGGGCLGGGGGAGGLLTGSGLSVSGLVNVSVGTGGVGGNYLSGAIGTSGTNSSFANTTVGNGINARGGGRGGSDSPSYGPLSGGSGGGAIYRNFATGGAGTAGQGYAGGNNPGGSPYSGSGGGGCNGIGGAGGSSAASGAGGIGCTSPITGIATNYSTGGKGGVLADTSGLNGTANTGDGGNGGGNTGTLRLGGTGGSGVVIIQFLTTGGTPISASFTQSVNPSTVGQVVTFTDTSTGSPVTWNWTFSDNNPSPCGFGDCTPFDNTSSLQNPVHIYLTAGTYNTLLNVTNATGSWSNTSQTHTVVNASGFTPQDIWMVGQYTQTFHVTDSSTGLPITAVDLYLNGVNTYTTTNGTGYVTTEWGAYSMSFISEGYTGRTISYYCDGSEGHDVQLTASSTALPISIPGTAKDVKFHIQSFWGTPIYNANVSVQGITTTTGNWDWLALLSSIDLDSTPINSTEMVGLTDTNGDVVFLMLDSIKYNISVTASGYTFPLTIISPQASQYTISANMNDTWFSSGNDTLKEVNVSVSWVTINSTHSFVNITYDDQTATTTGGNIRVYREAANRVANATPIAIMNITASTCSNSTKVDTPTGGASYRVDVNATTTSGDNIVRTFTHYFKGAPVTLPGWTSETLLWLALFIVIFTAAFAGALHAPQMSIIICVEAWVFWAIGWLDALISQFWYGETAILGILTLATFITIVWNITEGKAKGKRSS